MDFRIDLRLDDIIFIAITFIWLFEYVLKRKNNNYDFLKYPLLFWIGINLFSILFSITGYSTTQTLKSLYYFARMGQYVLLYFIIRDFIDTEIKKIIFFRIMYFITIFICFYGLYQYYFLNKAVVTSSLSDNHMHIGLFMILNFFLFIGYLSVSKNIIEKLFITLLLPLMIYLIILSASRIAIFTIMIRFFIYLLFINRYWAYLFAGFLIIIGLILSSDIVQYLESVNTSRTDFINLQGDMSLLGRFYIWLGSINLIFSNPVILLKGAGLGGFANEIRPYVPLLKGGASGAHNNYLQILIETGIIGLFSFIVIFYRLLKNSFKRAKDKLRKERNLYYGYFCGLIGILITGISQESISVQETSSNFLGYFFLVTAVIFSNIEDQSKEKN